MAYEYLKFNTITLHYIKLYCFCFDAADSTQAGFKPNATHTISLFELNGIVLWKTEELRRDLSNVRNRQNPKTAALQRSMNPNLVLLAALDERSEPDKQLEPAGDDKENAGGNA